MILDLEMQQKLIDRLAPNRFSYMVGPLLYWIGRFVGAKYIAEVGIGNGYTAVHLAALAKLNGGRYVGIDIDKNLCLKVETVLLKLDLLDASSIVWRASSKGLAENERPKDGFDLVFIDGNHRYKFVKKDAEVWGPYVRPGGLLVFHDIIKGGPKATFEEIKEGWTKLGIYVGCGLGILVKNPGQ